MKLIKGIVAALALSLVVTLVPTTPAVARVDVDVSFGLFYNDLSPHGSWYVSAQYGRVWQPSVYRSGWNPYYDGHWEYTDFGWTWVSDYDWGSVPYHYGTWVLDARYGWVWVPGYTWAPAWVVFRTGTDYCGWAPVPVGWSLGASIDLDPSFYIFVSTRDFLSPRIRLAVLSPTRARVVINNTRVINNITIQNNIVVNRGPDVRTIERRTGRRIAPKPIERVARVAPFERVSRDRLQVSNEQGGRGRIRAAEPMSSDRPLPSRTPQDRGSMQRRDDRNVDRREPNTAPAPRPDSRASSPNDRRPVTDQRASDERAGARQDEIARSQERARQDRARTEEQARAEARARQQQPERPRSQADERAKADAAAKARADADARARARQQPPERTQPQADDRARSDAAAKARAEADAAAKAKAEAKARADARAKAKRDAEKKKEEPKKDEGNQ